MDVIKSLLISASLLVFASCSHRPSTVESGFTGAFVGAGTGAIIGAVIANGDVGASAALGAAIGVPAGIVLTALYYSTVDASYEREDLRLKEQVEENQQRIFEQDRELESLRAQIKDSGPRDLDDSRRRHIFNGPTRGNYYR